MPVFTRATTRQPNINDFARRLPFFSASLKIRASLGIHPLKDITLFSPRSDKASEKERNGCLRERLRTPEMESPAGFAG